VTGLGVDEEYVARAFWSVNICTCMCVSIHYAVMETDDVRLRENPWKMWWDGMDDVYLALVTAEMMHMVGP